MPTKIKKRFILGIICTLIMFGSLLGAGTAQANTPPSAEITGSNEGEVGVEMTFDGSQSEDIDGTIISYWWEFADGTTGMGVTVKHTYLTEDVFNVTLSVSDDGNPTGTNSTWMQVVIDLPAQPPVAEAGPSQTGETGDYITFDGSESFDPDGDVKTYLWDFDNGNDSDDESPSVSFDAPGVYTVTLTVTDWDGMQDTDETTATITSGDQAPTADAGGPYEGKANTQLQFDGSDSTDPDGDIDLYEWDFGDDTAIVTGFNPKHNYAAEDTYTVTLTVTDSAGLQDSATTTADVVGVGTTQPPVADASGPYGGLEDETVQFDGTGSSDADTDAVGLAYEWDFGDDSDLNSSISPAHRYAATGIYPVRLTVTDEDGETDVDRTVAHITTFLNTIPLADAGPPQAANINDVVTFDGSASSDSDGIIVNYAWNFGDGSAVDTNSGVTADHAYTADDLYTVSLTVTDHSGGISSPDSTEARIGAGLQEGPEADAGGPYAEAVGVDVNFDGSASTDDTGIATYAWDFGDSAGTSDQESPVYAYATSDIYSVTLVVTDDDDNTDTQITQADISLGNQPPVAEAGDPYSGTVGVDVEFDGSASSDEDGNIVTYAWDFGDGAGTSDQESPVYAYAATGTFPVILTVTDNDSDTDRNITKAVIGAGNQPPTADAGGPYSEDRLTDFWFDGTFSSDDNPPIANYDWDFGDGNTGSGAEPMHRYSAIGINRVALTVTDDAGVPDSDNTLALIGLGPLDPFADVGGPYRGAVGADVSFDGSGSMDLDGDIVTYDWDFGDGNNGNGETTDHEYTESGIYPVTLTVTDDDGGTDTSDTKAVIGYGGIPPEADAGGPYNGVRGEPIPLDGSGSRDLDSHITVGYSWDFGDDSSGGGEKPIHAYTKAGVYDVVLQVTDKDGKVASSTTTATIDDDGGVSSVGSSGGSSTCFINTLFD